MRFIPTRVHGMLDYLIGVLLIAAPWVLDFADGGAEQWIPVVLGAGVILYSLITDYELSVARVIPVPVHLALDVAGGALLAVSPWLFGFSDEVWAPHVIVGLLEIGARTGSAPKPIANHDRSDDGLRAAVITAARSCCRSWDLRAVVPL